MSWQAVRTTGRVLAVAGTVAAALTGSFAVAGPLGLVVAADCLGVAGLLLILAGLPRRSAPGPRPAALTPVFFTPNANRLNRPLPGWLARRLVRRATAPGARASDFPAFGKISSDLTWAPMSRWHYDHGTRLLLARLLRAALVEGQRVDPAADPDRARRLAGDDLWQLLAPSEPSAGGGNGPGVDLQAISAIVGRLERLWPEPAEKP